MSAIVISSIATIAFSQGGGGTTDMWKLQGTNVLKKDTSGYVGIGTLTPQEKLHLRGEVRIDGLKGPGEHWVYVDDLGRLRKGPPKEPPDVVKPPIIILDPNEPGRPCRITGENTPWISPEQNILSLCTAFHTVQMGPSGPHFNLILSEFSPNGDQPNVLLRLRNILNPLSTGINQPTIQFDNGEDGTDNESWLLGGTVSGTGTRYFSIGRNALGSYKEFFRIKENGDVDFKGSVIVGGTIHSPSGTTEINGNFSATGIIKSGNSIYIDGTAVGADNSNKIFSSNNLLTIHGGIPGNPDNANIKVGIGVDIPESTLDVNGNVNISGDLSLKNIKCSSTNFLRIKSNYNENLFFYVQMDQTKMNSATKLEEPFIGIGGFEIGIIGSRDLILQQYGTGKVGIGTTDPQHKLQVEGDIKSSGNLLVGGDIELTGEIKFLDLSKISTLNYWQKIGGGPDIFYNAGNVGIGTNSYPRNLTIMGEVGIGTTTLGLTLLTLKAKDNIKTILDAQDMNGNNLLTLRSEGDQITGEYLVTTIGKDFSNSKDKSEIYLSGKVWVNGDFGLSNQNTHICFQQGNCIGNNNDGSLGLSGGFHIKAVTGNTNLILEASSKSMAWDIGVRPDGTFYFGSFSATDQWITHLNFDRSGNFNFCGIITAKSVFVNASITCDFVFAKEYNLQPLQEVEQFIKENEHLQDIPSAKEMQKNGVDVGDLQMKLLQKVEENTLYIIGLNKKIEEKDRKIEELEERIMIIEQKK